jgi:hypothetical protein
VVTAADRDALGSVADRRPAASSTLEIPEGFLRVCVLAGRRQQPPKNITAHDGDH